MILSVHGVIEIILYSFLNFLPFMVLALYTFRHRLRFSKNTTAAVVCLATLAQLLLGIWACFFSNGNKGLISFISTAVYAGFYFLVIKTSFGKTLFILLMLSHVNNFIVIASKCFEGMLFPQLAKQTYRWSFSLMTAIIEILVLTPLFIFLKKNLTKAVEHDVGGLRWRQLWLVPATFYIITHYSLYDKSLTSLEIALEPKSTALLVIINAGAFLVYSVVVRMIDEDIKNIELEAKNHQLAMQSLQYESLRERINEARRAKHDLRHHLNLLSSYADSGDFAGLKTYLRSFLKTIPEESSIVFCEHFALNMLIAFYFQQAKHFGVELDAAVSIPAKTPVSDCDLCVLLGNLLENALDACSTQKSSDRRIILRGKADDSRLVFTIDNTFENIVSKNQNGVLISTKHSGDGIGVESAKAIVCRYSGTFNAQQKDGLFCTSVLLNI